MQVRTRRRVEQPKIVRWLEIGRAQGRRRKVDAMGKRSKDDVNTKDTISKELGDRDGRRKGERLGDAESRSGRKGFEISSRRLELDARLELGASAVVWLARSRHLL